VNAEISRLRHRIRWVVAAFIVGLVLSGVTAFPLLKELALLGKILDIDPAVDVSRYSGLQHWIALVWLALRESHDRFPFLAYGTDWLAFGHLVIALFFIPAWRDPARYRDVFVCGLVACAGVFVIAFVCGPIREIPTGWRWIDSSFGILGAIPLLWVWRMSGKLELLQAQLGA
jgi:hypothetical protein